MKCSIKYEQRGNGAQEEKELNIEAKICIIHRG
jgi:hypothetical protein